MKQRDLKDYLDNLRKNDYQRDNFDTFLKKTKFSYKIPTIHIAGSNGKGTVANCLYQCLVRSGNYKVGKFTSPYDLSATETIEVNNTNITNEEYFEIIDRYQKYISKYHLSSFEVETLVALTYFKDKNVDIAIVECGMGGEDDATNIFIPILSVITSISMEHTQYLGDSIGEIALNKAGIIKDDVPVLIANDLDDEAKNAIVSVSSRTNSKVILSDNYIYLNPETNGYKFTVKPYNDLFVPSFALFTIKDVAIALSALKLIEDKFPVDEKAIYEGVENTPHRGRFEVINEENPKIIIDGAHNPEGVTALTESLSKMTYKKIHIVFAAFKDKNIHNMLGVLNFLSKDISLTTFDHPRAKGKEEYFLLLEEYPFFDDPIELIKNKIKENKEDVIVVCGSLAFSYYVLNHKVEILEALNEEK